MQGRPWGACSVDVFAIIQVGEHLADRKARILGQIAVDDIDAARLEEIIAYSLVDHPLYFGQVQVAHLLLTGTEIGQ